MAFLDKRSVGVYNGTSFVGGVPLIKWFKKLNATQLVAFGFWVLILLGALLLMLPFATRAAGSASFLTCLFTSTSATCVTGLIVVDTATEWTLFGQVVILALIQIGGLGFMTILSIVWMVFRGNIGLYGRTMLMQTAGFLTHESVSHLIKRIFVGTMVFEGIGALALSTRFIPAFGFWRGVWYSIFHSISAFCNAGFDLLGRSGGAFSSVLSFRSDPVVMLTLALLIITGGIGFLVWGDIAANGFHFKKYRLHSKIVLSTTTALLVLGTVCFFFFETKYTMQDMNFGERLLSSFFLSTTTRTAGFDNVGVGGLSDSSAVLASVLMLIGGSPGSTAGGIKTTTLAILILDMLASSTKRGSVNSFGRRIAETTIKRATATIMIYLSVATAATIAICAIEPAGAGFGLREVIFEVLSALDTVGLTMGITTHLTTASKIIVMLLMYAGRIGGISLVLIMGQKRKSGLTERPTENILVG